MSSQRKRSRFAKKSEEVPFVSEYPSYSDDYMAPLKDLVDPSCSASTISKSETGGLSNTKPKGNLQSLMDESREKSMAVPIGSSNVGFKLLKKFGYNEGEGLGKDNAGMTEPIAVKKRTHTDVSGLGVMEKNERVKKTLESIKISKLKLNAKLQSDFISDRASKHAAMRSFGDMKKAQKAIYELDERAEIPVHELTASLHIRYEAAASAGTSCTSMHSNSLNHSTNATESLPSPSSAAADCAAGYSIMGAEGVSVCVEGESPADPSLEDCLCYLREVHYYCYYCGAGYNDTDDLLNNRPGLFEDAHSIMLMLLFRPLFIAPIR